MTGNFIFPIGNKKALLLYHDTKRLINAASALLMTSPVPRRIRIIAWQAGLLTQDSFMLPAFPEISSGLQAKAAYPPSQRRDRTGF